MDDDNNKLKEEDIPWFYDEILKEESDFISPMSDEKAA